MPSCTHLCLLGIAAANADVDALSGLWWEAVQTFSGSSPARQHLERQAKTQARQSKLNGYSPHWALDGLLPEPWLQRVAQEIPESDGDSRGCLHDKAWSCFSKSEQDSHYQNSKNQLEGEQFTGPATQLLFGFLRSPSWVGFLESTLGIQRLIPDPSMLGAGIHNTLKGGFLKLHADFNYNDEMMLHRRVNILLFLNDDWKEEFGGHVELWNQNVTSCGVRALPIMGRIVAFRSTDFILHGHPHPLTPPRGRSRRSIAMYYYTTSRPRHECFGGRCTVHNIAWGKVNCARCHGRCCAKACSVQGLCRSILQDPEGPGLRSALEPLVDVCSYLPANIEGTAAIYDGTWVGEDSPHRGEPVTPPRNKHAVRFYVFPETTREKLVEGATHLKARKCLNALTVAALAVLVLELGASGVLYTRILGRRPTPLPCGRWGDWRDGIDQLWAPRGAEGTLWSWFTSDAHMGSSACATVPPTAAMDKELSDKGSHGHFYTRIYDHVLRGRQCDSRHVLEVGIGSVDGNVPSTMLLSDVLNVSSEPYKPGASLRGWRSVFPSADVVGMDVDSAVMLSGPHLQTHVVNTLNGTRVQEVLQDSLFDFTIDDGFHDPLGQRATLRALWPHVRLGGMYGIEDMEAPVARGFASEMKGVAVDTGSWAWLVLATKFVEKMPVQPVRISNLGQRNNACWTGLLPDRRSSCCGYGGAFEPWAQCGFKTYSQRDTCCIVHFLTSKVVA
eukprot:TRINITY_DN11710_c0_g1_i5.p1 TRINITY_DN11710_c0_g1~~TRINITY_DN11710_c0_g1_i5.p1  ORF type:complete len:729 (+),score=38.20 TRINITY_DN11710_c0_g1_i5:47-2233(+)